MSIARELRRRLRADQSQPRFEPCLPRPAKQPPAGPGWIHEIKHAMSVLGVRREKGGAFQWVQIERRGRALAIVSGGLSVAIAIGVPVGAFVGAKLGCAENRRRRSVAYGDGSGRG